MSKLINEYPLVFLPALAVEYGLNEAIVIQQIHYWTNRVKPSEDGFVWVYNSIPEWNKQFPFWSERTIFSILKRLREIGVLTAERKSDNPWNQTLYYRLNYEMLNHTISQSLQDRPRKTCKVTVNTETTIDYFEDFWKAYPKKVAKEDAIRAWSKIKMDEATLANILKAIKDQGLASQEKKFVPHPATWLNKKRWEDEVESTQQATEDWRWRLVK